jgi:hypothetical protein
MSCIVQTHVITYPPKIQKKKTKPFTMPIEPSN